MAPGGIFGKNTMARNRMCLQKGPCRARAALFCDKRPCFGSWRSAQHKAVQEQLEKWAWTLGNALCRKTNVHEKQELYLQGRGHLSVKCLKAWKDVHPSGLTLLSLFILSLPLYNSHFPLAFPFTQTWILE